MADHNSPSLLGDGSSSPGVSSYTCELLFTVIYVAVQCSSRHSYPEHLASARVIVILLGFISLALYLIH